MPEVTPENMAEACTSIVKAAIPWTNGESPLPLVMMTVIMLADFEGIPMELLTETFAEAVRTYKPSVRRVPAKPAVPKPVYWEDTPVPNATTCPPEARPKFMHRTPLPEVES